MNLAQPRCGFLMKFVKDLLNDIPPGPYSPFGDERITFGKLTWAASVASSRAFRFDEQLQLSGGAATIKGDPVIVPMIDFVNINIGSGDGANVKVRPGDFYSTAQLGNRKHSREDPSNEQKNTQTSNNSDPVLAIIHG